VIAVIAGAAVAVSVILLLHGHAGSSVSAPERPHGSTSTVRATPQQAAISRAQDTFVTRYLAYLDGTGTVRELPFSSITAREQVARGGRIPPPFRDGPLRVSRVSGANTAYSAQATVTASNRSESYVMTVQLLLTQHGWKVAQVATPDLAIDDRTRPVRGPAVPAAGRRAGRAFAIAYAAFRTTRMASALAGMTATARAELQAGQDPLAGATRSTGQPRLVALRFGPLQSTEFSATATVQAGRRQQFTVLMVNHAGRWECDAFL
jgi:hypothetical protein